MLTQPRRCIFPLGAHARTRIASSSRVASLNQVVLELIQNSINADAGRIRVDLSYVNGSCTILDDGIGIPSQEFAPDGKLVKNCGGSTRHSTYSHDPLCGTSLADIAGVSTLAIESKTELNGLASVL